jgi:hypothetical protein
MLSINNYSQKYIDETRLKIDSEISTYNNLVTTVREQVGTNHALLNCAIEAFEPNFFNNMVLALDNYFGHRSRTMELKDGNPLNEVRILCNSIINNNNKMCTDKTIKFDPAKSVLKYKAGDEIKLNEEDFVRLSDAFFVEIEKKYM